MDLAASRNPFQTIILTLALFMGGLGRCIHYREERTASPQPLLAAVQARLDAMFSRIHRALLAYEPGRPARTVRAPSAACHQAAADARAARAAAEAPGTQAGDTGARERERGLRLPQRFGWLVRLIPEAANYESDLRALLNDPVIVELLAKSPVARRTLRSLCNMLGVGTFMVPPAHAAALGEYEIGRGWRVRDEPVAQAGPTRAPEAVTPEQRQNE